MKDVRIQEGLQQSLQGQTDVVRLNVKAKEQCAHLQRTLGLLQDKAVENHQAILNTMNAAGVETEEDTMERLNIFSMPLKDVKDELAGFDEIKPSLTGKSLLLRYRLLACRRQQPLPDTGDDGDDDGDETKQDQERMKEAEIEKAMIQKRQATGALKSLGVSSKGKKLGVNEKDAELLANRMPAEQLLELQMPFWESGVPSDGANLPPATMFLMRYGDIGGVPYSPGQGATPGEIRLMKAVGYELVEDTHLNKAQRIDMGGLVVDWKRIHSYQIHPVKIMNESQVKNYKKALKSASAVGSAGSAAGSTIDEDNDAYIAELNGSSVLSTPRGDSGSGGSGGSGLGGQRDAHGRCEGQHIASAIEASMTEATVVEAAATQAAIAEVAVFSDSGKRLTGAAAKKVAEKRLRTG